MGVLLCLICLLCGAGSVAAQGIGLGYYDLEAIYDTIPSPFYNDDDFTPHGRNSWTTERYERQITNIAAVIDSLSLPAIGLFGVENVGVVHDLVEACHNDYSYIHRTRNSLSGKDFTLLYFGDQLFIEEVYDERNMLIVDAQRTSGEPLRIILCCYGDDAVDFVEENPTTRRVVAMGNFYPEQIEEMGLSPALWSSEAQGRGNYLSYRGWVMHDRIGVSDKQKVLNSGVYIAQFLLSHDSWHPLPTFDKGGYKGGYSKFLPVFIYIK